jgi:hypothetical protein
MIVTFFLKLGTFFINYFAKLDSILVSKMDYSLGFRDIRY